MVVSFIELYRFKMNCKLFPSATVRLPFPFTSLRGSFDHGDFKLIDVVVRVSMTYLLYDLMQLLDNPPQYRAEMRLEIQRPQGI